jgi:hypothetical protein
MKRLLQIVEDPAWPALRAEFEQSIVQEFAHVPKAKLEELHARLVAARDFFDYIERIGNVETARGNGSSDRSRNPGRIKRPGTKG